MTPPLLVDRVAKRFGPVTANEEVSLRVSRGEVVGLLGANGAGKTTVIRILLGLLRPDAGAVSLPGGAPDRRTRSRVGYVPQGLGLWTDLTVRDHFELSRAAYGRGRAVAATDVAEMAGEVVGRLPLGWRRRVAFALALAHEPEALVLDEPTSGVDPLARARLWEAIRDAAEAGRAVLVSTHYMDEATMCDRVVLMSAGRVVASGSVGALTAGRRSVLVSPDRWQPTWAALDEAGLRSLPAGREVRVIGASSHEVAAVLRHHHVVASVQDVPATLEEVFLETAGRP